MADQSTSTPGTNICLFLVTGLHGLWGTQLVEVIDGKIRSGSAPGLCPASARAVVNKWLNQNSWQYLDGRWQDGDFTVTCDDRNIQC